MLSEHRDVEQRLRQEIYDKVGQTGRPTYDQMREMKYMRAFLNGMCLKLRIEWNLLLTTSYTIEVLRLYPPVLVFFSLPFSLWNLIYVDICCSPVNSRYIKFSLSSPSTSPHDVCSSIGLWTKRLSFLLQTAIPHRSTSQHRQGLFFSFSSLLSPCTDERWFQMCL